MDDLGDSDSRRHCRRATALKRQPDASLGLRYLWGGVAAGIALALLLAGVMLGIATILSSEALDYFQTGMVLVVPVFEEESAGN